MASQPAALAHAWNVYQAGSPAEAVRLYRLYLQEEPGNADAWCLLGIVQRAAGEPGAAAVSYREALRLRPDFIEAWNNLGNALIQQSKLEEAVAAFEQVLRLRPDFAEAHNNLGAALRHQGKWAEAVARYQKALRLAPNYAEAHNNLGDALKGMDRLQEAAACYRQALRLRPNYPEAHTNLGNVLIALDQTNEAIEHHREALRLRPNYAEAHSNLGNALTTLGQYAQAEACYREALRLKPDFAEAHHNLGTALAEQEHLPEAEACYREALRLRPDYLEASGNLATALLGQGKAAEAAAVYDHVLASKPDSPDAHLSRALICLTLGFWKPGWEDYEWRWRCSDFGSLPYTQPLWDGSPLLGRTILLHTEQGLGDTFLAVRYAALVKQRGGVVILACPPALTRLLAHVPGVDRIVERGAPLPDFDCHAPLMSLPGIFHTTPDTVPADVPYLSADPVLVERWQRELPPGQEFRIGIVWQGNPRFKADRFRSIPLDHFAPLAAVEGVRLYSLQKGFGSEQLGDASFPVLDLGSRLDETTGVFQDTAAVMKNLDLVISPDTAIAHLAGALGVPVWVALPFASHWVWLKDREDSPWYPSARLFRQNSWGNWKGVFERMTAELRPLVAASRAARPILVEISPGELLYRIGSLEIQCQRLEAPDQRWEAERQLAELTAARDRALPPSVPLARLAAKLRAISKALAEIEEELRRLEEARDFGPRFLELARSLCSHNDQRTALVGQVNDLTGFSGQRERSR